MARTKKVVKKVDIAVEKVSKPVKITVTAKCEYCGKAQLEREAVFCDEYCRDTFVAKS